MMVERNDKPDEEDSLASFYAEMEESRRWFWRSLGVGIGISLAYALVVCLPFVRYIISVQDAGTMSRLEGTLVIMSFAVVSALLIAPLTLLIMTKLDWSVRRKARSHGRA